MNEFAILGNVKEIDRRRVYLLPDITAPGTEYIGTCSNGTFFVNTSYINIAKL